MLEAGPSDVGDDDVLRLERWMGLPESNNDAPGDHRGRTGPVKLRTLKSDDPCGTALLQACET